MKMDIQKQFNNFKLWRKKRKESFKQAPWYKKTLRVCLNIILIFFIYLFVVDINFLWLFGKSPSLISINHPEQSVASEIYSSDGKLIGKFFKENRTPVAYDEIAPIMIKTLIATEDERFYEHFGIDVKGLFAAAKDMSNGRARGASTISQQLVKNMFKTRTQYSKGLFGYIPGINLVIIKTKEWVTAVKIEMFYSKQEILTMYLNTVDFGSNTYGIKTACKTYFNNKPKELTIEQAATLVGLLKATTTYNPRVNPVNSKKRRNVVLDNLAKHHIITKEACDSLKNLPIVLDYKVEQNYDGDALYFRDVLAHSLKKWCEENGIDLYADGIKIYTTIDSRMQQYAEDAVNKQMKIVQRTFNNHWGKEEPWRDEKQQVIPNFIEDIARNTAQYSNLLQKFPNKQDSIWAHLNKRHRMRVFDYKWGKKDTVMSTMDSLRYTERFLHSGFVALEPQTGYIKAWVGDINFDYWKYDKVTSKRQPGSTFKLFVYTTAFNKGLSPCDRRRDEYIAWNYVENGENKQWIPHNVDGEFTGDTVTLKFAFARSINSVAVKVAQEVGIDDIIQTAYSMGIKTKLNHIPSVCLGSSDVSLLELVNSYSTVVNEGVKNEPVMFTRIEDKKGKVLYEHTAKPQQVLTYETSFLMTQMLLGGLTEPLGTSQALFAFDDLFKYKTDFGGKTGTSSNHSDAWYVGVTPNLVGGAWVGSEHRCIHFRTGKLGEGSKTALPVFAYFMEKVLADTTLTKYRARFPTKPKEKITKSYSCHTPYRSVVKDTLKNKTSDSVAVSIENAIE